MIVTFKHDGTGFRAPEWPDGPEVNVEITAAAHTYESNQRHRAGNWLVWPLAESWPLEDSPDADPDPRYADTFAEAVFEAAGFAAGELGGVVLDSVAGVPVPEGWDAVDRLITAWQNDPPFGEWTPEHLRAASPLYPA